MTSQDITKLRDLFQRAFDLDYDAAYAMATALEHAHLCEEYRLDAGRITHKALAHAITQLLTDPA